MIGFILEFLDVVVVADGVVNVETVVYGFIVTYDGVKGYGMPFVAIALDEHIAIRNGNIIVGYLNSSLYSPFSACSYGYVVVYLAYLHIGIDAVLNEIGSECFTNCFRAYGACGSGLIVSFGQSVAERFSFCFAAF